MPNDTTVAPYAAAPKPKTMAECRERSAQLATVELPSDKAGKPGKLYLDANGLCNLTGLSLNSVYNYIKTGRAPAPDAKLGAKNLWKPETAAKWAYARRDVKRGRPKKVVSA